MGSGITPDPRRFDADALLRERSRLFTDRNQSKDVFFKALASQNLDERKVLNFYGVGGIGKSRLQRELCKLIESSPDAISVRLDLSHPTMRRQETALYHLRHCLGTEHDIQLARFDIAFAVHWQQAHPDLRLNSSDLPFLEESEVLSEIMSAAGWVPVLGIAASLLNILRRTGRNVRRWQRIHADEDLKRLDEMEPVVLLDALTHFFAKDLREVRAERNRRCVIFVDAHEALSEDIVTVGAYADRDGWIRDLALQTPGVLHVICSRDALQWGRDDPEWVESHLELHLLGDFSMEDRLSFLSSCGVDGALGEQIASGSEGVPFYLNLAVDSWEVLSRNGTPTIGDIGANRAEILKRFIGHIPREEAELLKILSVPRSWDRELFADLVRHFQLSYALSRFDDFSDYSFIAQTAGRRWMMHALMREALLGVLSAEVSTEIDRCVFEHYRRRIDEEALRTAERFQCFREACYHAASSGEIDPEWFAQEASFLMHRGGWAGMRDVLDELDAVSSYTDDQAEVTASLLALRAYIAAWILRSQGRLREARAAYEALDLTPIAAFADGIRFQFANVLRECGEIVPAGKIYETLWKDPLKERDPELAALVGIQLADFHYVQGRFRQARRILEPTVDVSGETKQVAEALRIMGHVLRFNELRRESLVLYERAGAIFTELDDLYGEAAIATNLAEVMAPVEPEGALRCAQQAIDLNSELGSRLEVGKAYCARAIAQLALGDAPAAMRDAGEALQIQGEVGYYTGQCQARLASAFAIADSDRDAAVELATKVIDDLFARRAYPTLVLIAERLLLRLEQPGSRESQASWAAGTIEWLDDAEASHARLDDLVVTLACR